MLVYAGMPFPEQFQHNKGKKNKVISIIISEESKALTQLALSTNHTLPQRWWQKLLLKPKQPDYQSLFLAALDTYQWIVRSQAIGQVIGSFEKKPMATYSKTTPLHPRTGSFRTIG